MTKRISRISPHQAGKVLGILYFIMGLVFVPIFILAALLGSERSPFGMVFAATLPFIYGVMGYIFVALGSLLYNAVARLVGGLEITLSEQSEV